MSDPVWEKLREESRQKADAEPIFASYLHLTILNHKRLEDALSFHEWLPILQRTDEDLSFA